MADLDSFFAKKDKKKLKGKKFGNFDEIAKRIDDKEKKLEKDVMKVETKKTLNEVQVSVVDETEEEAPSKKEAEEEWTDFQEDEHDLTDLKLQNLQIEHEEDMGNHHEDGEGGSGHGEAFDGVWGTGTVLGKEVKEEEEEEEIPVPVEQPEPGPNKRYMAPHLRYSSAGTKEAPRMRGKPRVAPDITNEMAFPSLSDAKSAPPAGGLKPRRYGQAEEKAFEDVRHGSTKQYQKDMNNSKLCVNNRFDALSNRS